MANVALIGFGLAGKTFHAPMIAATEGLNLCKVLTSRSDQVHELYPETEVISEIQSALSDEIDLIVIATPNKFHYEHAKLAIEAGKNIIIDKPITPTVAEGYELLNLAKQNNVVLSVFHNRRFDGDYLTVRDLVHSTDLGRITYFESNFNRFRPEVDQSNWRETTTDAGGVFFDLAPHLVDQALDLFGPPLKVFADIDIMRDGAQNDDYFHLIFQYEKCRVQLNASAICKNTRERFVIHGTKGSFTKHGLDPQEKNLKHGMSGSSSDLGKDSDVNYGTLMTSKTIKVPTRDGDYRGFYKNVLESIQGREQLVVNPSEALFVMEVMELCLKSSKEQRWISVGQKENL